VAFSLDGEEEVEHPTSTRLGRNRPRSSITLGNDRSAERGQHVHYSLVSQYLTAKWVLDLRDENIYWCTADPGWVHRHFLRDHSPFALGVTQCVLDAGFSAEACIGSSTNTKSPLWYSAPTATAHS